MLLVLHPRFATWLEAQADIDLDLFGDLIALINKLEELGRALLDGYDECHPVRSSPCLHALRRTPPTVTTPYATSPPVVRMLFGFVRAPDRSERAVLLVGGDKTVLNNLWYPPNVTVAHARIHEYARTTRTAPVRERSPR